MRWIHIAWALALCAGANSVAHAQQEPVTPPVQVRPPADEPIYTPSRPFESPYAFPGYGRGTIPWDSGAISRDSQLVGPYAQPVWTTQRPWASVRAYVLPPGTAQVEQWIRPTWPPAKEGGKPEFRMLEEFAIGLPGRFQLDVYERWNIEPNDDGKQEANHEGVQVELRWAVADWGRIPFNPTFYIEWVERGGKQNKTDKYEAKLLLADELTDKLFIASNLIIEQEVRDEYETELGWNTALSRTLIERVLMGGVEMNLTGVNAKGARSPHEMSFTIGPSAQLRLTNRFYITSTALFGCNDTSPQCQMYVIAGYQFGARNGPWRPGGPSATMGN